MATTSRSRQATPLALDCTAVSVVTHELRQALLPADNSVRATSRFDEVEWLTVSGDAVLRAAPSDYFRFWNYQRLHQALGCNTPATVCIHVVRTAPSQSDSHKRGQKVSRASPQPCPSSVPSMRSTSSPSRFVCTTTYKVHKPKTGAEAPVHAVHYLQHCPLGVSHAPLSVFPTMQLLQSACNV